MRSFTLFNYIENYKTYGKDALIIKCTLFTSSETFIQNIFSSINIVGVVFKIRADTCVQEPYRALWSKISKLHSSRRNIMCSVFRNRYKGLASFFPCIVMYSTAAMPMN